MLRSLLLIATIIGWAAELSAQIGYTNYNALLGKYIKGNRVDYMNLRTDREILLTFTDALAAESPDSAPDKYPGRREKLAYWINAYNAFILKLILENYPVGSIKDIMFIGFTVWLKKNRIGGKEISFKALEDDIIRGRFKDPRIHFAINCASVSCPPIRNEAYVPDRLDQQLDESTADFINNDLNFMVDEKNRKIYLSAIFDWYRDDFLVWLTEVKNKPDPVILDYIELYYQGQFRPEWQKYDLGYHEYDWSLNDINR